MKIAAGTDKGLVIYSKVNNEWKISDMCFIGLPIGAFHQDEQGNWWVAINHKHWGPKIYFSYNQGENFKEIPSPKFEHTEIRLRSIWTIASMKCHVYVGTEPASLFKWNGQSFDEVDALSKHPSRDQWQGGGKGSRNPFLHSIIFHPENPKEIMVGISCAGVFRSSDAGKSWVTLNNGLRAFYLPYSDTEIGHDPHSMIRHPKHHEVIWQQNHCGIYRSTDNGKSWNDLSDSLGKAVYGFDLVIDDEDIDTAWVIPAQSDDQRMPHQGKLAVYQTTDAGANWKALRNGLPQKAAFDMVLRSGFDKSGRIMAFGTNNGNLYLSSDNGENWIALSQNLSSVRTVNFID